MNSQLQPLYELLLARHGWLAAAVTWFGAIKIAAAFVEVKLQHWLEDTVASLAQNESADDDAYLRACLSAKHYRLAAFLLRLVSIRLPTLADFERARGSTTPPPQPPT